MATTMSSTPPSSTSSFRSSNRSTARHFSRASSTEPPFPNLYSAPEYIGNEEGDGEDYSVTTTTTTIVRSPRHGTTPQVHPFAPETPARPFTIKREATPSTPPKAQYAKQNWPATPVTPVFKTQLTSFSPSASPTKAHGAYQLPYQSPLNDVGEEKDGTGPSFDQLRPRIPHPNELVEPSPVFPAVKKWYVITTGQEVGIFASWLDVVPRIRGVPDPAHVSCPTYSQALAEYREQFDKGAVHIILVPGSEYAERAKKEARAMMAAQAQAHTIEDEYGDFTYDEEDERAVYEAEVYAEAEKAYKAVLLSHGFLVPK